MLINSVPCSVGNKSFVENNNHNNLNPVGVQQTSYGVDN